MTKSFKTTNNDNSILEWKSGGLSNETLKSPNINLEPEINLYDTRILITFDRGCLKQDESFFTHKGIVTFHIVYQ